MDFVGRKAFMPPLGSVTVAGMFPRDTYTLRVVDMNVEPLSDTHLAWADVAMTSTMALSAQVSPFANTIGRKQGQECVLYYGKREPTFFPEACSSVFYRAASIIFSISNTRGPSHDQPISQRSPAFTEISRSPSRARTDGVNRTGRRASCCITS